MFKLNSKYTPKGDQLEAIKKIVSGINKKYSKQTLLGVTGSGKTFTMANIIEQTQKPTLIISHNKTLANQLYKEFKNFFPENSVHYFVSYYDYYQPEAYNSKAGIYIEKDVLINKEIDRLRHATTQAIVNRKDIIVIASVSCIYGIGERENYTNSGIIIKINQKINRNELLLKLIKIRYTRNEENFDRGNFRIRGENIDIHLSTGEGIIRIVALRNEIEKIIFYKINPEMDAKLVLGDLTNAPKEELREITILPAKHFIIPKEKINNAIVSIQKELKTQLSYLKKVNKNTEAHRLAQKTNHDIEMMREIGYCGGIENYSLHLSERKEGSAPFTLIDFFPKNFLLFIDESHVTIPQIAGMYSGDKSRKQNLVDFGFRLPSAKENRPLNFEEFESKTNQSIYVSATPKEYEIKNSSQVASQIIRPTGLLEPKIEIKSKDNQNESLIKELKKQKLNNEKTIITTLTKKTAEELTEFLNKQGVKTKYLHSEIKTMDRVKILKSLKNNEFDCLVGINLLREGLDLPNVSLIIILDADKPSFLRDKISLMQIIGRASRHKNGRAILYANKITPAIKFTLEETKKRRKIQRDYNLKN